MQQLETLASVWLWIPQMIQPLMGYMHWIGLLSRKVRPRKILISTVPAAEILHLLRQLRPLLMFRSLTRKCVHFGKATRSCRSDCTGMTGINVIVTACYRF